MGLLVQAPLEALCCVPEQSALYWFNRGKILARLKKTVDWDVKHQHKQNFVIANCVDTDKMGHYAAFYLDSQCLQKYPFRSSCCLLKNSRDSLNQQSGFASYLALPFIKPNITKIFQTLMSERTEYIHSLPATVVLSVANLCKQMLGLIWIQTGTDRIS